MSDPGARSGVQWTVPFARNKRALTPKGKSALKRLAQAAHYFPLENITLVGYAGPKEPYPRLLAARRAKAVSRHLVEKHGLPCERIRTRDAVVETSAHKVDASIVPGAE